MRLVLTTLAFILAASPALATDHTNVVYGNVANGYVLQDVKFMATEENVFQGGMTRTWGKWSLDGWMSVELSGNGTFGKRGFGDEIDITGTYDDTFQTFLGPVTFQASAAYYVLADFGDVDDDLVQVYVDGGRPFTMGPVTITPFVRLSGWVGVADNVLVRPGVRPSIDFGDGWSLGGEWSRTHNFTEKYDVNRGQITGAKHFDNDLTLSVTGKFTEDLPQVWSAGFSKKF